MATKIEFDISKVSPREKQLMEAVAELSGLIHVLQFLDQSAADRSENAIALSIKFMQRHFPDLNFRGSPM